MKPYTLLLIPILLFGCYSKEPKFAELEGKPLPSFKLLLSDSVTYLETERIPTGKPTVFFYYGPYCTYSGTQIDEIINEIDKLKDIQFYAFTPWPYADMKKFIQNHKLNEYSNITTGVDYSGLIKNYFHLPGVPFLAIYGKDKKLKKTFLGNLTSDKIKEYSEQ